MRDVSIFTAETVRDCARSVTCEAPDGRWVPARPMGYPGGWRYRIKAAWLVFTGKADAVTWPDGESDA